MKVYLVERTYYDYDYEDLLSRWIFDDIEKVWDLVREHRYYDLEIFEIEVNGDGDPGSEKGIEYNWFKYVREDLAIGTEIVIHNDLGYQWGKNRLEMVGKTYKITERRGNSTRKGTIDVQVRHENGKPMWFHDDQIKVKEVT